MGDNIAAKVNTEIKISRSSKVNASQLFDLVESTQTSVENRLDFLQPIIGSDEPIDDQFEMIEQLN